MPNNLSSSQEGDTGLYELYKNVVVQHVNETIKEAERYAGKKYFLKKVPTSNWFSRDGKGPEEDPEDPEYGSRGMSYSFGGKMNIDQFNDQVSPECYAKETPKQKVFVLEIDPETKVGKTVEKEIASPAFITQGPDSEPAVPGDYTGDLLKTPVAYEDDGYPICSTGSGQGRYKYAGLRRHEYNAARVQELLGYTEGVDFIIPDPPLKTTVLEQFKETLWAGIDCSGLVQRSVNRADDLDLPGAHSDLDDLGDGLQCKVGSKGCEPCGSGDYVPEYAHTILDKNTSKDKKPDLIKTARKGDVVVYSGHIALVYSDRLACDNQANCTYEIIHAYGGGRNGEYRYPHYDPILPGEEVFARKVIRTWQDIAKPTGFGRIKLWD